MRTRSKPFGTLQILLSIFFVAVTCNNPAYAQVSTRSGTITQIFLSGGYNYAFRISLLDNGTDPLTDCNNHFAYLNIDNDNYQAIVAELLTFYVGSRHVNVNVIKDTNGFCKITESY